MKSYKDLFWIVIAAAACAVTTACTETSVGNAGDYGEMTFSARVTAMPTKVTENRWDGGERIGVSSSDEVKAYTVDAGGAMTAEDGGFYWEGRSFGLSAWYPLTDEDIDLTDQSTEDKFFGCDLLASTAVASSKRVHFTFGHKMTRMWWELQQTEGYSGQEVDEAVVTFLGYGAVSYENGELLPVGQPDSEISTWNVRSEYYRDGQAMMVPCEMWGKPLIRIEIGGDTYVYTPSLSNENDVAKKTGILVPGSWQRYYLAVNRKTLTVEVDMASEGIGWDDGSIGEVADAKLAADIPSEVSGLSGYSVEGLENGLISDKDAGFSISYTENGTGGLTWNGSCRVERTETGGTHTYTFSDVRTNITVSYLPAVQEGWYLYDNGTWGPDAEKDGCMVAGRIFAVGKNDADNSVYPIEKVRGYVVCTSYLDAAQRAWVVNHGEPDYLSALADIPISSDETERESDWSGYLRTSGIDEALTGLSDTWKTTAPFWYAFKNAGVAAPDNTSGWYIPTVAQLRDIHESGYADGMIDSYWSSQVYAGTADTGESHGIQDGDKTTIWAMRYYVGGQEIQYGWSGDPAKLLLVLTF